MGHDFKGFIDALLSLTEVAGIVHKGFVHEGFTEDQALVLTQGLLRSVMPQTENNNEEDW